MNAPESRIAIPAIGTQLAGGTVLGHIFIASNPFALIVPPKAEREREGIIWHSKNTRLAGAMSTIDGLANTRALAEDGSPLGQWAVEKRIGGFDDWYIGARLEQLTIHSNLPLAGDAYKKDGAEAFNEEDWYWTSTQGPWIGAYAWLQGFENGGQYFSPESNEYRAFVVRREPIR